jgi:hypothetical protein
VELQVRNPLAKGAFGIRRRPAGYGGQEMPNVARKADILPDDPDLTTLRQ